MLQSSKIPSKAKSTLEQFKMNSTEILLKLVAIKDQITDLGIKHLENQMPVALSDVGILLRPFTGIDTALISAIKKLSEECPGSIPKANSLKP